jgi:hypothetical protein
MNTTKWAVNNFESPKHIIPEHWRCPRCEGALAVTASHILRDFSYQSLTDGRPSESEYRFAGLLKCIHCRESISIAGEAYDVEDYVEDHNGQTQIERNIRYCPRFFFPALHLFVIPSRLKESVIHEAIEAAFGLFFCDTSASANKIRIVVELVLTDWSIPRHERTSGGLKKLNTHKRIELFRLRKPEVADWMQAIKWIGNDGSHDGVPLTPAELLVGFDLLEHILKTLYDNRTKSLSASVRYINKRRGLASKRKRRT